MIKDVFLDRSEHEWEVCRCCGFQGEEVFERVQSHNDGETGWDRLNELRLCDFCACVGGICAGAFDVNLRNLTVKDLSMMLHTAVEKVRLESGEKESRE